MLRQKINSFPETEHEGEKFTFRRAESGVFKPALCPSSWSTDPTEALTHLKSSPLKITFFCVSTKHYGQMAKAQV